MKLLKLDVEGYRSLRNVSWTPGDLNVLIGPNASGKTNLIRLLELLSIFAKGGLGQLVQREGGMGALVWDGRAEEIRIEVETSPMDLHRDIETDSLTYQIVLARLGQTSSFNIKHELLGNFFKVRQGWADQPFKFLERDTYKARIFDEDQKYLAAQESVPADEALLSLAGGPFVANRYLSEYRSLLASWTVYSVIDTQRGALVRQPATARYERHVFPDGENLVSVLHTLYSSSREFQEAIDAAMNAAFGDSYEGLIFPPVADQRVQLSVRWRGLNRPLSAADLSDGTLRFLFLLAVLANPAPPPLVALEEPELGLHPHMLPIIAEYAADAANRTQVILTTHSPEFLNAFRDVTPTTTVFELVDGETRVRVLRGEDLEYWLNGYSLGEYAFFGGVSAAE